jgi:hypothetical protein
MRVVAALVVLMFPLLVSAQSQPATATVTASANVILGLKVEGLEPLQFDEIMAGEAKQINLDGTATGASVTGNERAGKFKITTQGSFMLEFSEVPTAMIGPGGAQMPVSFTSGWSLNQAPPSSGSNILQVGGGRSAVRITSSAATDVYIFLGATVVPPVSQTEGLYETRIVLTATFGVD